MPDAIDITGVERVADTLYAAGQRVEDALAAAMQSAMAMLAETIADTKLSGQVLKARSGTLRASLQANAALAGGIAEGSVSSALPYAAIHEYGGVIERVARLQARHSRRARRQGAAYRIVEPEASYLRSTLGEQADAIETMLTDAVMEALSP